MNTALMFSSATDLWETPQGLFDMLNAEFGFTIDVCATADNAKCLTYFSPNDDGLSKAWSGVCWMNPPYGREIGKWVRKAYEESRKGVLVVGLLPARTDTRWFHEFIHGKAEVRFLRGRLKFGGCKNSAPFPSMVVIWRRDTMTGTNPGAWPDDWHGDVDDGKRKAFAELDKTIPLYTAADLAKAREEGRKELEAKVSAMVAVLKDYERWEADLLMCDEAWRDRSYPVFTEKLYASFFSIQGKRNAALLDAKEAGGDGPEAKTH